MITRWITTTLLIIGLTLLSFGHQTLAPDKQAQIYILAGGSWADLCSDGNGPLAQASKCTACVISHGCTLPANSGALQRDEQMIALSWDTQDQTVQTWRRRGAQTARAPPFI